MSPNPNQSPKTLIISRPIGLNFEKLTAQLLYVIYYLILQKIMIFENTVWCSKGFI